MLSSSMDWEIISSRPTLLSHKLQSQMAHFASLDSASVYKHFIKPSFYAFAYFLLKIPLLLLFWGTLKWEKNKSGRIVGWSIMAHNTESRRQLFRPFAFHILLGPYLVMVFTSGHKELQLPEYEMWVLSLILNLKKLKIVPYFWQKLKWAWNAESEISLDSSLCFSL